MLAITHLAQVAAFADAHYRIAKVVTDDRTSTRVDQLDSEGVQGELAAMLGGLPVSDKSLQSASELLGRVEAWKSNGGAPDQSPVLDLPQHRTTRRRAG